MSASCTPIRRKQSLGVYFLMEMEYFFPFGAVWMISLFIVVTNVMLDVSMVVLMVVGGSSLMINTKLSVKKLVMVLLSPSVRGVLCFIFGWKLHL